MALTDRSSWLRRVFLFPSSSLPDVSIQPTIAASEVQSALANLHLAHEHDREEIARLRNHLEEMEQEQLRLQMECAAYRTTIEDLREEIGKLRTQNEHDRHEWYRRGKQDRERQGRCSSCGHEMVQGPRGAVCLICTTIERQTHPMFAVETPQQNPYELRPFQLYRIRQEQKELLLQGKTEAVPAVTQEKIQTWQSMHGIESGGD